jgi:hypothetical protein
MHLGMHEPMGAYLVQARDARNVPLADVAVERRRRFERLRADHTQSAAVEVFMKS